MRPRDRGSRLTASLRHSKTLLLYAEGRRVPALDLHGNALLEISQIRVMESCCLERGDRLQQILGP
jgi:hypothetical protein